ncbi:MAG: CoA-binding protein [Alphaproteobacteria bacterium]
MANHDSYTNDELRDILSMVKTIAMVGASANWNRPSYFVMKYLQAKGYRVIPVNPSAAGQDILGETCYANLADIPGQFDMVDIFRNSEAAAGIVDEAIQLKSQKEIKVIWMQLTVRNDAAARRAEAAGMRVVMDRCPKIEYSRLYGELSWGGINSGIITSQRRKRGS